MICSQCKKEFTIIHGNQKNCPNKKCKKERKKIYNNNYQQTDKNIENRKRYMKKYLKSDKGIGTSKKYYESDEYKKYQKSEKRKQYLKDWYLSDYHKEYKKKYYLKNADDIGKKQKSYQHSDQGRIIRNQYNKTRKKTDIIFKLIGNIRSRLNRFLKVSNLSKKNQTLKIVGCTPEFLKKHLEKQFHQHPDTHQPMNWKNYTLHGWHVDHIIPLGSAKTPEDVEKLMHYTNLQPMWAIENLKKGARH